MKGPFSKPLLFENGIFSAKTNYLGSVRVAKDPSTLGGSCVVPFPKKQACDTLTLLEPAYV